MGVDGFAYGLVLRRGHCEAAGMHHPDCPGVMTDVNYTQWAIHHRYPRAAAKRERVTEGVDDPSNLMLVWNGPTGLGAGGCHGRIESYRRDAFQLGYLLKELP